MTDAEPGRLPRLLLILSPILNATLALMLIDAFVRSSLGGGHAGPLCGPGGACNDLSASPYARFLGVPWAFWGLAFALATLTLGLGLRLRATRQRLHLNVLRLLCGLALAVDLGLAALMIGVEELLCGLCLGTYGMNLLLALAAALAQPRGDDPPASDADAFVLGVALTAALAALGAGAASAATLDAAADQRVDILLRDARLTPRPAPAGPVHGAASARARLILVKDPRCLHCARLESRLWRLLREAPERLSLQLVHAPSDAACNPRAEDKTGACALASALIALEAAERLEEAPQVARARSPETLDALLSELGLDPQAPRSAEVQRRLSADLAWAQAQGVEALPTLFVNGARFEGSLSLRSLRRIIARLGG